MAALACCDDEVPPGGCGRVGFSCQCPWTGSPLLHFPACVAQTERCMCKVNFWQPAVRHKHQPRASISIPRAPAPEWDIRTTRCLSARLARRRIFTRFCRLSSVARLPPQLWPRARILRDRTATTDRQGPIAASVRKGDRACALGFGAVLAVVNACTCLPVTSSWCLQPASLDPNNHLLPQWGLCGVPRSKAWPSAGMLKVAKALAPPTLPQAPAARPSTKPCERAVRASHCFFTSRWHRRQLRRRARVPRGLPRWTS